jgi:DNA-binding transcriptional LysR family regulator
MSMTRNLDLQALECFDAVMRERSVTRAAERLGVSQSSASEVLARLRERFDDPLFVRTREGMEPTDRALALVGPVRAAIEQLRALLDDAGPFEPATAHERFRLSTSDYTQLLLMPALTRVMQDAAPQCRVEVHAVNIRDVERALESADIDLAIAYYPEPPESLRRSPLFVDRYVGIARRDHPAAMGATTAPAFAALAHVSVAPSGLAYFSGAVDSALETLGLTRRVVVSSPHFLLAAHLVSCSDLVLVLPSEAARALAAFLPIEMFELPITTREVELSMYWHERQHHSPAQQWLRERVREILAAHRSEAATRPAAS